jgi:hypothetical protein
MENKNIELTLTEKKEIPWHRTRASQKVNVF